MPDRWAEHQRLSSDRLILSAFLVTAVVAAVSAVSCARAQALAHAHPARHADIAYRS
jgi:hypothetical protein